MRLVIDRDPNVDPADAEAEAQECEALCSAIANCLDRTDRLHLLHQLLADFTTFNVRLVD